MIVSFFKNRLKISKYAGNVLCLLLCFLFVFSGGFDANAKQTDKKKNEKQYIKWIDFTVTYPALKDAMNTDISSYNTDRHVSWIDILAYLASRNGGNFSKYKKSDITSLLEKLDGTNKISDLATNRKLYDYYHEAYGAVLGGMIGEYTAERIDENGNTVYETGYGLKVFSPFAKGYYYSHFDDFGSARSYGYRRPHLGHDLVGSIGTPIIAIESGYVEAVGWNQYGGWRIGIRSFDHKRYYYYAHLRKNHPYNDIYEGKIVCAGEVIGYLGMTGYSVKENVNNIKTPHLHFGLQIIFDPVQKDGVNQIWIDMYELTKFLASNRSPVYRDSAAGEYYSKIRIIDENMPD
ncbi:MAG: M23 family metallopeptidase [Clostridiales bacterium]|nr:M23 family metallopeptidase [Clostridiales bacterium]